VGFGIEVGFVLVQGQHPDEPVADEQRHSQPTADIGGGVRLLAKVRIARPRVADDGRLA